MKLWMEDYTDVPYIAPGMVKGKELVVDEWEVSRYNVDVIAIIMGCITIYGMITHNIMYELINMFC